MAFECQREEHTLLNSGAVERGLENFLSTIDQMLWQGHLKPCPTAQTLE
jgi:hypothetical protein